MAEFVRSDIKVYIIQSAELIPRAIAAKAGEGVKNKVTTPSTADAAVMLASFAIRSHAARAAAHSANSSPSGFPSI